MSQSGSAPRPRQKTREIVSNFLWLSSEKVVDAIVAFAVTVLVARYLGPTEFGTLAYFLGLTTVFAAIARMGLDMVVIRELVRDPQGADLLLGTASGTKLAAGIAAAVGMLLFTATTEPTGTHALLFAGILATTLVVQALDVPDMLFAAHTQSRYAVISRSLTRVVMAIARIGLVVAAASLTAFVSIAAAEAIFALAIMLVLYRLQGNRLQRWAFDIRLAMTLARQSAPLMVAGLAILVMMRIDLVFLEKFRGGTEVGIYACAIRISDVCVFLATGVMTSVAPSLFSVRSESREHYNHYIACLFQGLSVVTMLIAVVLTMASDRLIVTLLGSAFAASASVLRIYIWSTVFIALGVVQGQWLVNEGYGLFVLYRSIGGAAINIGANFALIPSYGAEGAALAAVIAQFASSVLANLVYDKENRRIFVLQIKALAWLNLHYLARARFLGGRNRPDTAQPY